MKGVVLAGGTGTRLHPLTKIFNKHLLPVGKYPMINYSIQKLRDAGITDILLITNKQSLGWFAEYLGGGEDWGVNITYKIQNEAGGIAQAVSLAEGFIHPNEKFAVILGDNLFQDSIKHIVEQFQLQEQGAKVLLKEVHDPRRYGVPILEGTVITAIEEKPEHPSSTYAVTGIYLFDAAVFEIIKTQKPSKRGELEITDVNNVYAAAGMLKHEFLTGWWIDAGTHESLLHAALFLSKEDEKCL
ncbi:NTP transferase domain-containing protein [Paenibacillus alkaliterrae]|uniref:sugar phosphate nucleotidyltransferase n=1 Tax=Paenibacillus alkaliterrae TaxID=320909 RepID=UPI001F1B5E0D|nr:sugar phosphate nucleotidyltransferase [Paenibacillus alkaliterrae]MCF2940377.1 NTP transferase domain-containing protein [Paenibacillus alkaliterrae]